MIVLPCWYCEIFMYYVYIDGWSWIDDRDIFEWWQYNQLTSKWPTPFLAFSFPFLPLRRLYACLPVCLSAFFNLTRSVLFDYRIFANQSAIFRLSFPSRPLPISLQTGISHHCHWYYYCRRCYHYFRHCDGDDAMFLHLVF